MTEIKVNLTALENKICKLRCLRDICEGIVIHSKSVEGSGEAVNQLSNIDEEYVRIHSEVLNLIGYSIGFFENIATSVERADLKATENFR